MPCAEGELCAQPDTTPQAPRGHGCQGGCGGRLHGICGSMVGGDENENHRICSACVANAGKRKAPAADSAGEAQSKRPKATNGGSKKSQPRRARPDFRAKLEMAGTRVSTGREEDDEQEDSGDDNTGLTRHAPPAYGEL